MKNPNLSSNPEGVASLNELLEARKLTGQIPETMPAGIKAQNGKTSHGDSYCYPDDCFGVCQCPHDCSDDCSSDCSDDCDC